LCVPFTKKDIKEAMFLIPIAKSPGLDGFSTGFFKKRWDLVDPLVINAVKEFFRNSKKLKKCNATNLVLLPKVQNPITVNDFRLILCCNVVYKCISNLISNRLKEVLPELVNLSQEAFVKGSVLLYNVLVCQELARCTIKRPFLLDA